MRREGWEGEGYLYVWLAPVRYEVTWLRHKGEPEAARREKGGRAGGRLQSERATSKSAASKHNSIAAKEDLDGLGVCLGPDLRGEARAREVGGCSQELGSCSFGRVDPRTSSSGRTVRTLAEGFPNKLEKQGAVSAICHDVSLQTRPCLIPPGCKPARILRTRIGSSVMGSGYWAVNSEGWNFGLWTADCTWTVDIGLQTVECTVDSGY